VPRCARRAMISATGGWRPGANWCPIGARLERDDRQSHPAEKVAVELKVEDVHARLRERELLACERVASLSDEWRARLWAKIIRLRLGRDYRDILEALVDAT
jgi:hypothetical protein